MSKFLLDNALLIAVVIFSAGALLMPLFIKKRYGPEVTPAEATTLINRQNAVVVDLRKPADYRKGHIVASVNLPATQVQNALTQLDRKRPVVLVDQNGNGARPVARLLRGVGFDQVYILAGGLAAWQQEKLPLE